MSPFLCVSYAMKHQRKTFYVVFGAVIVAALLALFLLIVYRNLNLGGGKVGVWSLALPQPVYQGDTSIEAALKQRRSIREYQDKPLSLSQLSQLLWAAQGVTSPAGYRTAPSAGALYPLRIYVLAQKIDSLPVGIYLYSPAQHSLKHISADLPMNEIAAAAFNQVTFSSAPVVFLITGNESMTASKYGNEARRLVAMEVGHVAENMALQAVSLHLGLVTIGGFDVHKIKALLALPRDEAPYYLIPAGVPNR